MKVIKQYSFKENMNDMFANGYKESFTEAKLRTNVIDSNYDDSHRPWPEVKKELINKYKKKGYTNVEVVRTKTDTKGLRNYYVCGDLKESFNKNITVEEDEEAFKEEFGEAERTKLNDEIMEDYEDVLEEAKVNRMVNEIIKDSFNEPIEESDEERIERKSNEYIGDRYEKVYETYCKCVGHEYGSVDESNLPLDENLLNYVSCVHNYDIENLKENIKQHMANTTKKWLEEGKITKEDIARQFLAEMTDCICQAFSDQGVDFLDKSVWGVYEKDQDLNGIKIGIYNLELPLEVEDDLNESDEEILEKFVKLAVDKFIQSATYKIDDKNVKLKEIDVKVKKQLNELPGIWSMLSRYHYYYGSDDVNDYQPLCIFIQLRETHDKPAWSATSIDDVAQAIGKFEQSDSLKIGFNKGEDWDEFNDYIDAPIKYIRKSGLAYSNGFPYWDRFTKIKGMSKIYKNSSIKMAAQYNDNNDIILLWAMDFNRGPDDDPYRTKNVAVLLNRSDFESAINKITL